MSKLTVGVLISWLFGVQVILAVDGDVVFESVTTADSHHGILGHYTFTTRLINNSEKIKEYKSRYAAIPSVSIETICPKPLATTEGFGMGEKRIVSGEEKLLHTDGICDCIGISVWDPATKIACLYHASKMELREMRHLFQEGFLDVIKSFSKDLQINLASCYWSRDLVEVIDLLQEQGFRISGLYVPDAVIENSEFEHNTYVDREHTPSAYFPGNHASLAMTLNTATGKVEIHPSWIK